MPEVMKQQAMSKHPQKLDALRGAGGAPSEPYINTVSEGLGTRNKAGRQFLRVLGVDPGFDRLGLAVLEGDSSRPTHVWSECIQPPKGDPSVRLAYVYMTMLSVIETYSPSLVAIETLFFSTNKKTAFSVAEARGAILAAAGATGIPVKECTPAQVKIAVTGYGSADKKAIEKMVPKLLSLPEKQRLDDEFDAIAIAIAGLSQHPQ